MALNVMVTINDLGEHRIHINGPHRDMAALWSEISQCDAPEAHHGSVGRGYGGAISWLEIDGPLLLLAILGPNIPAHRDPQTARPFRRAQDERRTGARAPLPGPLPSGARGALATPGSP